VIRTLKTYLAKDLARVTLLATAAITTVMTILAFIEPLREQGLTGQQALKFFGYVLPLMSSLTLPFAALFAATIVYGRFSQDNELMACRASGVCTLTLLRPAIWLGVAVTTVALALGLYAAPILLGLSEKTAKNDLRQIAFHRLKKQGYVKYKSRLFHADEVDPQRGWLRGVVGVDHSDPDNARCLVAASAKLEFHQVGGKTVAVFHPTNPAVFLQDGGTVGMEDEQRVRKGELPSMKDEPKTYDWNRLWRTWARPQESPVVTEALEQVKRYICIRRFQLDVLAGIQTHGRYDKLVELPPGSAGILGATTGPGQARRPRPMRVRIRARRARLREGRNLVLLTPPGGPERRGVFVQELVGQKLRRELKAREVRVRAVWSRIQPRPMVGLTLIDVKARYPSETWDEARTMDRDESGPFAVPAAIVAATRGIELEDLYADPLRFERLPGIVEMIRNLRSRTVRKLLRKVQAEVHQRLAYGLSCMFMVMLGAALGLMLRGGHLLAAFAISAIPGLAVVAMILMGRQLISNPDVPASYGITAIWGGFGVLAAVTLYIYAVPMRR